MSAPRRLLGLAGAALWVRWRLLGLWTRRVLGGRRLAPAGSGHEPPVGRVPVEGVDYEPAELPDDLTARLDAVGAGLLDHARSTAARRTRRRRTRRRRGVSLAMAALVSLAALGAGATALVGGSTGVPAVDRLLGTYEERLSRPDASEQDGPSGQNLQPGATDASQPLEVELPDGSSSTTTFYVSAGGEICNTSIGGTGEQAGTVGCQPMSAIAENLAARHGHVAALEVSSGFVIVKGYVDEDVERVSGRGPTGALHIELGPPWSPAPREMGPVRPFVAVGTVPASTLGSDDSASQRYFTVRNYEFEATMRTGRSVRISP